MCGDAEEGRCSGVVGTVETGELEGSLQDHLTSPPVGSTFRDWQSLGPFLVFSISRTGRLYAHIYSPLFSCYLSIYLYLGTKPWSIPLFYDNFFTLFHPPFSLIDSPCYRFLLTYLLSDLVLYRFGFSNNDIHSIHFNVQAPQRNKRANFSQVPAASPYRVLPVTWPWSSTLYQHYRNAVSICSCGYRRYGHSTR